MMRERTPFRRNTIWVRLRGSLALAPINGPLKVALAPKVQMLQAVVRRKVPLEDRFRHHAQCRLYHPVAYRWYAQVRIEALNHALRGLPADRIRFHICWGSWHGPHTTDIPLQDIVDLVLSVNAGAYSVEAGNVRHEHEWRVWEEVKLPDGKILIPGVVSHATNIVEHPQVVADRIVRYAKVLGRENVIAGTDCGLGGRIHPQIAWAKLQALSEGAALASKELWS